MFTILLKLFSNMFGHCVKSVTKSKPERTEEEKEINKQAREKFQKEELLYWFTLANAMFPEEREIYRKYLETENLLRSFPILDFLDNDPLNPWLYGAMEEIPYEKILSFIEKFFPYGKKEECLLGLISEACNIIAQLMKATEKEERKNNPTNNEISTTNWQDVLLSFQIPIIGIDKIKKLFSERYEILYSRKTLTGKKLDRSKYFQEIIDIQIEMQNYHDSKETKLPLIKKKNTSRKFQNLIEERGKNAKLEFEYQERAKTKLINSVDEKLGHKLETIFEKEKTNIENIKNEIVKVQSMTKIFIIIYQLSKHLLERGLEKSLSSLNPEQKVGFSFLICIAEILNNYISYNKEDDRNTKNKKYLMDEIIKYIYETKSYLTNEILKCVEKMQSDSLYNTKREDFIKMFGKYEEKESNYSNIETIEKFEEQKTSKQSNFEK